MICINGHYEAIDDLYDVANIIRKYYNDELAYELEKIIEDKEAMSKQEADRLEELEEIIEEIRRMVW